MSFAVGFVKPLQFNDSNCSDCDPTSLDSVLEALRGTSKGKLPYPEPLDKTYNLSDVCESKYIGDLSHIIERDGFKDEVSFADDYHNDINSQSIFTAEDEEDKSFCKEGGEFSLNLEQTATLLGHDVDASTWLSYRSGLRSPHHSPEKHEHEDSASEDEPDGTVQDTLPPTNNQASDDGGEFSARVEALMSRMHIDQSLPAMLARIQLYQRAYVNRVASIHLQNMEELRRCREQQLVVEQQLHQDKSKEKQIEAAVKEQSEKILAEKEEAAKQRKQELLAKLGAEEERRLQEQAEQQRLDLLQAKQIEKEKLIAGMQESLQTFSSSLDTILKKIKRCEGVSLPPDTTAELNETLQQGSEVLHSAAHTDTAVLQRTAARVSGGLSVIAQLEQLIDTQLSEASQVPALDSASQAAAGAAAESEPLSLAPSHPTAAQELAAARTNFENLSTTHDIVAQLSSKLLESDPSEQRGKLAHAISVVNKFHNDNDASNREKLHNLVSLITGNRCAAGSQHVQVSDPQSPAAMFVKEQLSSKLIALAHDKQVSSQAVYASLMLRLWAIDPLLRSLCLYQLYKTCPYLVPYVPDRRDYDSVEEYHRALGYRHKDGCEREALDIYLKRMGSASQLFGRLVSVEVENTSVGPHLGWQLLSRILVSPVRSAVTCSVVHGFLSTAGSMMIKVYGKQFHKLMQLVIEQFLPLAEKATLEGGEADLASLKTLLSNYLQSRTIPPPPEGYRALL